MKTSEQHLKEAHLLAKNAAQKAQIKTLRKQRADLLRAAEDFVFLEKTNMTKKQTRMHIEIFKEVIAEVKADY